MVCVAWFRLFRSVPLGSALWATRETVTSIPHTPHIHQRKHTLPHQHTIPQYSHESRRRHTEHTTHNTQTQTHTTTTQSQNLDALHSKHKPGETKRNRTKPSETGFFSCFSTLFFLFSCSFICVGKNEKHIKNVEVFTSLFTFLGLYSVDLCPRIPTARPIPSHDHNQSRQ